MWALARLTFREALAKKTFIAFFICSTVFLLLLIFAFQIDVVKGQEAMLQGFGEQINRTDTVDLEQLIRGFVGVTGSAFLLGGIFLSIFATAGLVPSMLEKGSIDLLLSKPLRRIEILVGRSIGALSIVFINIAYLILGVWFILGLKTGMWIFDILYIVPLICLVFVIIYAWMVLWGVLLSNSALTIMLTYLMYGISAALLARDQIYAFLSSKVWGYILDFFYYLFPRISEMMAAPITSMQDGGSVPLEPYITSFIVAMGIFGLAGYIFQKKEF